MYRHFLKPPPLSRLAMLLFVIVPVASWVLVKPVRVLAPTLAGVTCPTSVICLDDVAQLGAAADLYAEGTAFVAARVGAFGHAPRVIFCASEACAASFGLGERSAVTVGTIGTVIGPRAWKPYYLRHELIHQLQAENLGTIGVLLKPSWFVEGMAYALSDDPRAVLAAPWQGYRAQFNAWNAGNSLPRLWALAKDL
ncbi:MAG: hypothetical protein JWP29_4267 [Rhodoferax sp.]|nr:hypothetical protein [Rhodoferax sp.]